MKLALISDIHANLQALQATLDDIALRAVDRIVCLGDIVGYNTRPAECVALVRRADALCVAGNHDLAVCGRLQTRHFSQTAARAVENARRRPAHSRHLSTGHTVGAPQRLQHGMPSGRSSAARVSISFESFSPSTKSRAFSRPRLPSTKKVTMSRSALRRRSKK